MGQKGQAFERERCREFSRWWTDGKRDDIFWRNRVRITSKTPKAEAQLGDIMAMDPIGFPFTKVLNVELKTGYSKTRKGTVVKNKQWGLLDVIDGDEAEPTIMKFWKQCLKDSIMGGTRPMLVFKRDHYVPVVCIRKDFYHILCDHNGKYIPSTIGTHGLEKPKYNLSHGSFLELHTPTEDLMLFRLENFLHWLKPAVIEVLANKMK
jgi:hypothetical protein